MGADSSRQMMRSFYDAINRHDIDALSDCIADDITAHHLAEPGREAFLQYYRTIFEAFPDLRFELLEVVAEEDIVAARSRMVATHAGELMGVPASGNRVVLEGSDFVHLDREGRFVEYWGCHDNLAFMQQIGASPADIG